MRIREGTDNDFEQMAALQMTIYPSRTVTVEDYREADRLYAHNPQYRLRRWVALEGEYLIGQAEYRQNPWRYHPRRFEIDVRVHPNWQGLGVGLSLYEHLTASLEHFEPLEYWATIREDQTRGRQFLEDRGFVERRRLQALWLELDQVSAEAVADLRGRVDAGDIRLRPYAALADDPQRELKLYELEMLTIPDQPGQEDFTPPSLEDWRLLTVHSARFDAEASVVALDGDHYIGASSVYRDAVHDILHTGFTCVQNDYRRRGLATLMKLHTIGYAQQHGHARLTANHQTANAAMLDLNRELGFVPQPTWIVYCKQIGR